MTHNRAGVQICQKYNRNECQPSRSGMTCPADPSRTHQCNRCLQPAHVCSTPGSCSAPLRAAPKFAAGGKAKGKGKGKGKSKKW